MKSEDLVTTHAHIGGIKQVRLLISVMGAYLWLQRLEGDFAFGWLPEKLALYSVIAGEWPEHSKQLTQK